MTKTGLILEDNIDNININQDPYLESNLQKIKFRIVTKCISKIKIKAKVIDKKNMHLDKHKKINHYP